MYPTHMFIDLVVVQEKEEPLWILGKKVNLEILAQKFEERQPKGWRNFFI